MVQSIQGLNYTLYCNADLPVLDADNSGTDNLQDCIDSCTRHVSACWGISWVESSRICFRKKSSISNADLKPSESNIISALSAAIQMRPRMADYICPYPNLSTQKARSGMQFKIFCGSYYTNEFLNAVHVESLDDCLEECAQYHPLCTHVSYSADIIGNGWLNCQLKKVEGKSELVPFTRTMAHSAEAVINKQDQPKQSQYTNGSAITSQDGRVFRASCNDQRDINDTSATPLASFHELAVEDCVGRCSGGNLKCAAALYDASLELGYQNCFLFDRIPPPKEYNPDSTFFYLETLSSTYQAPPSKSKLSLNSGEIVGISLGSCAVVIMVGWLLVWWYRRRKIDAKEKST